ncbi:unnamed protein product [Lactuca virosa]|uniref:Uncharacterized protein n=1 Tax=Lactuca virosa TaxID=75947 RepID=A0AAU9P4L1_9ASTR|nr:unnamed protein product [Lactuca virosa]
MNASFFEGFYLCVRETGRDNRLGEGEGCRLWRFFRRGWQFWRLFVRLGLRQSLQGQRFGGVFMSFDIIGTNEELQTSRRWK